LLKTVKFTYCSSEKVPVFRYTLYVYKSSCRASPSCERIRVSIDRASRRKTFKCVHGVPFVGRGTRGPPKKCWTAQNAYRSRCGE